MTELSAQAGMYPVSPRGSTVRRIAIIVSLVLVLAAAGASLFLVRTVDSQLSDVANTYEVRRQAQELMLALIDAETGQRGYLLTRDQGYLAPYDRAIATMTGTYDNLLALVTNNPSQRLRLEGMKPDIDAKRAEMSRTIELASGGDVAGALALLRTDEGRELMDRIRSVARALIAEEDARLIERNAQMDLYRQWLVAAILAALGGAATLAYALFTRTQQQVAALAEQKQQLAVLNEELEAHIRTRTVEVEEARARAERERERVETLLRDTNHRISNSLATVSSLLGLQVARSTSDEVRSALEAAQARVHAIASGHRRLRLGDDLETTNTAEFLGTVIEDLATGVPEGRSIRFEHELESLIIPARDATTLGIVLGELVTNALKHAFTDGRDGTIRIRFGRIGDGDPALVVEDDGQGMVGNGSGAGLGALIIKQLARQYGGGEPEYQRRQGGGTVVIVRLPTLEALPKEP